jgi:hypothetical protein
MPEDPWDMSNRDPMQDLIDFRDQGREGLIDHFNQNSIDREVRDMSAVVMVKEDKEQGCKIETGQKYKIPPDLELGIERGCLEEVCKKAKELGIIYGLIYARKKNDTRTYNVLVWEGRGKTKEKKELLGKVISPAVLFVYEQTFIEDEDAGFMIKEARVDSSVPFWVDFAGMLETVQGFPKSTNWFTLRFWYNKVELSQFGRLTSQQPYTITYVFDRKLTTESWELTEQERAYYGHPISTVQELVIEEVRAALQRNQGAVRELIRDELVKHLRPDKMRKLVDDQINKNLPDILNAVDKHYTRLHVLAIDNEAQRLIENAVNSCIDYQLGVINSRVREQILEPVDAKIKSLQEMVETEEKLRTHPIPLALPDGAARQFKEKLEQMESPAIFGPFPLPVLNKGCILKGILTFKPQEGPCRMIIKEDDTMKETKKEDPWRMTFKGARGVIEAMSDYSLTPTKLAEEAGVLVEDATKYLEALLKIGIVKVELEAEETYYKLDVPGMQVIGLVYALFQELRANPPLWYDIEAIKQNLTFKMGFDASKLTEEELNTMLGSTLKLLALTGEIQSRWSDKAQRLLYRPV